MPKVVREDIDSLNAILVVTIGREDYEPKLKEELKKIRETHSIKGFRKGKTPVSFLKKMYGKSILSDVVTKMLQQEIAGAMSDEGHPYLGNPLPTKDQPVIDFDVNSLTDYIFRFDIGVTPTFEVVGVDKDNTFDYFTVQVPEEKVEAELELLRKQYGVREEITDDILEEDLLTLNAVELDGDSPKTDGWKTTFDILVQKVKDDDLKKELLGKKKGDTVRFNIFNLEADADENYTKKYLLNFSEADIEEGTTTGEMYEAVIETVRRLVPAELNQELFDKVFGEGKLTSEEQVHEELRKRIGQKSKSQAETLLYRELRLRLVDMNRENMPLPEEFLKRWVKTAHEKEAVGILQNFDKFADDMRWSLIKNKLYKQFELDLNEKEIREMALHRVAGYFGSYQYMALLENMVNIIMEDPEQVNSIAGEVLSNKLFYKLKDAVSLHEIPVAEEELEEKIKALEEEEKDAGKNEALPEAEGESVEQIEK